jgi:hypothetical protein
MSVPSNLEFLRKEAKALLKQCRSGNTQAIGRIRLQLPSLANLADSRISKTIKLADIHHTLTRERGHESWGDLKRGDSLIEQFLVAIRGDTGETRAILYAHPHVATQVSAEDTDVLVRAAATNILDRVKLMLACGFDAGKFGEGGVTALHAAAWHGHVEMVLLLLGFHAPVNSRDRTFGSSPLAWTAHGSKHRTTAEEDYCAIVNALVDQARTMKPQ